MPASPNTVSLDQAKDWAKRLHKAAPALGSLSAAQGVLAQVLGHASWHALTGFYANQSTADAPVDASPAAPADRDPLAEDLALANALYPGLDARAVEVLAIELDDLDRSPGEIIERAEELERREGMFASDAFVQAIEESVHTILPPPEHRFVRVVNGEGKRVLTLLPFLPAPKSRPKASP